LSALFLFLATTFLVLAIGAYCPYPQTSVGMSHLNNNSGFFSKKVTTIKVGGYFGIITALIAYYCGLAEILGPDDIITLPSGKRTA
jgi:succinate-acetate transporter protein